MTTPPLEFVRRDEGQPITEEEVFERFTCPNAVTRNLLDLLTAWETKARRVLAEHQFPFHAEMGTGFPDIWPLNAKTACNEIKDAWRVLMAIGELRRALQPKEPHEAFALASAGINLGLAIMEAHTRPYTQPAAVGIKVKDGGVDASIRKHGTVREREARYAAMRQRYEQLRAEFPEWGHYQLTDRIGEEFEISGRRVRDHVKKT